MKFENLDSRLSNLGYEKRITLTKLLVPVSLLVMAFMLATFMLLYKGLGIWGINIPVAWGFAIISFVWWVGIGHAGTFISAVLLLLKQDWRNSINRLAESMTLFAVACAGLYPLLHMGRPWFAYWLFPYPNDMDLYPQYRSPLVWDAFAVSTYATISVVFWYVGLIPDLAVAREQTTSKFKHALFSILSMGWSGEAKEWVLQKRICFLLAAIATPLVISVHSIVAMDFAAAKLPGWHSPFFPPYFVAGAIFSGFAMVICLLIVIRHWFKLEDIVTSMHIEKCTKFLMISGSLVTYFYLLEFFTIWYGQEHFEMKSVKNEIIGPKAEFFWAMMLFNSVIPLVLWVPKLRKSEPILFIVSFFVLIGMWLERYVIVVTTLSDTFLPAMKGHYSATFWDWMMLVGVFGIFLFGMILTLRFLPFIPITELKEEEQ